MPETVLSDDGKILFFKNSISEESGITTIKFGNCDKTSQKLKELKKRQNIQCSIELSPQNRDCLAFVEPGNKESLNLECDSIIYGINGSEKKQKTMLACPTRGCPIVIISGLSCIALIHASQHSVQFKILQKTLKFIEKKCNFREDIHRLRFLIWPGTCSELRKINSQFKLIFPKYMNGESFNLLNMIMDELLSYISIDKERINIIPNCPCHSKTGKQNLFYFDQKAKEKNMIFISA